MTMERLILDISTHFINLAPEEIHNGIDSALQRLGRFADVDRSYVFMFNEDGSRVTNTHEWCEEGIEPQIDNLQDFDPYILPWWMAKLQNFETIYIPRLADLPPEASIEKDFLSAQDIKSLIVVPMIFSRSLMGIIGFDAVREEKKMEEEDLAILRTVGDIFANALKRMQVTQELQTAKEDAEKANLQLTIANRELEQKNALTLELAEQANEANLAKNQFLVNLSHELRTPLNSMLGMTELLLESGLDEQQSELANTVYSSASTQLRLIEDTLDFSKIAAGRLHIGHEAFSLPELAHEVIKNARLQSRNKPVAINYSLAPDVPEFVKSDPVRLRQILTNLIGNAVKFTDHGDVSLVITRPEEDRTERTTLHFCVKDTGIGISASEQSRIFEKFTQVDNSISRRFGGMGVGLSITKSLIELMEGRIWLESEEGKGSCFYFMLPFKVAEESAQPTHIGKTNEQVSNSQSASGRILLVEDNLDNQKLAKSILSKQGYTVTVADNGESAIKNFAQAPYDLILMDIQMPGMDGFAATKEIRAREAHHRIPIIALTAHVLQGYREKCLQNGMDDYLTKPIKKKQLLDVLSRWLTSVQKV